MKAEDLMIGDWVIRRGVPEEPMRLYDMRVVARVAYLDQDGRAIVEKFDYIEPIPLTKDILEKNGFGFIDTSNGEYSSVWTGWWILEGLELGCCDNSKFPVFFNIADTNVKVNYVHELQHALKLCGIEKEIVL